MMAQAAATMPMMVSNGSVLMVCSSGMVMVPRGFDLRIMVGASAVTRLRVRWPLPVLPESVKGYADLIASPSAEKLSPPPALAIINGICIWEVHYLPPFRYPESSAPCP